jgi:uncharacterized membrane-anchored protein YhcB (DUF1043 family)
MQPNMANIQAEIGRIKEKMKATTKDMEAQRRTINDKADATTDITHSIAKMYRAVYKMYDVEIIRCTMWKS